MSFANRKGDIRGTTLYGVDNEKLGSAALPEETLDRHKARLWPCLVFQTIRYAVFRGARSGRSASMAMGMANITAVKNRSEAISLRKKGSAAT